jgi:hypothetical protein
MSTPIRVEPAERQAAAKAAENKAGTPAPGGNWPRSLQARAKQMKRIQFAATVDELRLLLSLASDQLFRRQFIDPKMPGYKSNPEELDLSKALVGRLRAAIDEEVRLTSKPGTGPGGKPREIL